MKAGQKILVSTNYELLNKILGKNFKGFYKGYYKISNDCYIWMISINGENKFGWVNKYSDDNTITEEYVDGLPYPDTIKVGLKYKKRLVFDKVKKPNGTMAYFVFRGLYELTNEGSFTYRVLRKVSDETDLF